MNAEQLLHHFDQIADAPDAVARLRQFIVDLAILGKLVPYHSNDENTTNLLARIEVEKQRLLNKGAINRSNPQTPISVEEIPILGSSPAIFVRLKEIAQIIKGAMGIQKANPGEYPLVTLAEKYASCDCYQFDTKAAIIPLISSTGHGHASMKRLHYQEGKFALGNILCAVIPYAPQMVSARFLYEYFCAYKELLFVSKMSGTANVSLTIGAIGEVPVPLISFNAQNRVDELMALCDELEAARAQREARRDQLVLATLHRLTNGDAGVDDGGGVTNGFAERARFYFNHLPRLTTRLEHIKQLRQTILKLAVQGKLIANNSSDNSSWKLAKLSDCATVFNGRAYKQQELLSSGTPVIRIQNLNGGQSWYYSDLELDPEKYCDQGDLLYAWSGTFGPYIWGGPRGIYHYHIWKLKLSEQVEKQFMFYMLQHLTAEIKAEAHGLMLPHMTKQRMESWPVLLPPLAEQHHIVAKVDELMALCDELEARLSTNAETRRQLLEATLYTALAGQHEAEISL